jgi:ABC-type branched-subunit amino acid transport system substrate-binding protein
VAEEFKAFADASAVTPPYADALARRRVISVGAPYMSREWMAARRPYAWSGLTDCTTVVEAAASYYVAKLAGKPAAYAGGSLQNQPRRAAILAPDNSWYQECAKAGRKLVEQAGKGGDIAMELPYRLDINQMAPQATTMISKLKAANITTVVCGCDPLILTFLTGKAREQGYSPEWVETGVAFTDQDLVGQIFDQQVWHKAFGVSFAGPTQPLEAGIGYRAFKAIRPSEEPSIAADVIYGALQMVAIGIQMAGPNLTPETFEQGMFRYPQTTGPFGTWKFGPGDYTTSQDAREVWWDANAISRQNDKPGAWIDPNNGARYPIGRFPGGEPNVPR